MRLLACLLALALIGTAHAVPKGMQRVYIFPDLGKYRPPLLTGMVLQQSDLESVLYIDEPCSMPIVGAENMHRMSNRLGIGCWGEAMDRWWIFVDSTGYERQSQGMISIFSEALFNTKTGEFKVVAEPIPLTFGRRPAPEPY